MDKWATKLVAEAIGIRTAPGRLVRAADVRDIDFEGDVVKPVSVGSSYGVTLARDSVQLDEALLTASRYDDQILVEHVVHGREIDVAVLREADGSRWAPPRLEIHASGLFDTATKYNGTARFTVPAGLDSTDRARLTQAALALFDALGCAGVARMDFFLTDNGPVLNEVNTMPGMTAESQVPRMFAAAGVRYEELVARLVGAASMPTPDYLLRPFDFDFLRSRLGCDAGRHSRVTPLPVRRVTGDPEARGGSVTEPMSRTELYWQVDYVFYELYPNAPRPLGKNASLEWRQRWIEQRDKQLNEEVNRVYWARYPEAPTELDATSPEWEPWRQKWIEIKDDVMKNVPEPEDVEIENAVSDDGELDLSHIKAAIRERLVDLANEGVILADTRDEAIVAADKLAEEVGAKAMQADTVHGTWESQTAEVAGPGEQRVRLYVTGWWDADYFTGSLGIAHNEM